MSETANRNLSSSAIGLLLIGLGALFMLWQFLPNIAWAGAIGCIPLVTGLMLFVAMTRLGKAGGWLAIPGSVVTTVGLILMYQLTFNHLQSWAYAWALVLPTSVGVGLMIHGTWTGAPETRKLGRSLALAGIIIFLLFGAFFELILRISGGSPAAAICPALLILLGIGLLMRRGEPSARAASASSSPPTAPSSPTRPMARTKPAEVEFEPLDMSRIQKKTPRRAPKAKE